MLSKQPGVATPFTSKREPFCRTFRGIDHVMEVILEVWGKRRHTHGLKLSYEAPFLRHFTAKLEPVEEAAAMRQ
jgi:tryptophanase